MTTRDRDAPPKPRSLAFRVLAYTAMMLLFGIVGPIFLAIGLGSDSEGTQSFAWIGLGITAFDVALGVYLGTRHHRADSRKHRLLTQGRPAQAEVLSMGGRSVEVNGEPWVRMRLRISADDLDPFEVDVRRVVSYGQLGRLSPGQPVPVRVDPTTREWDFAWNVTGPSDARTGTPGLLGSTVTPTRQRSSAERLAELDDLMQRDLISRDEYDASRARILGDL